MRLSIWQFLGLAAVIAAGYFVYDHWWSDQDQSSWITRFNRFVFASGDEYKAAKAEPEPESSDGWIR
ncbi:hypothetical protein IIA79_00875 [bacterium]|nr:hypothetical protein [bacterium]